ncbi:MAG: HsdM family class I SAM-dependent methyltransferase [Armatimonadota bacterium]
MTSLPTEQAERKRLGAWYTPLALVRPLVRWAIRKPNDHLLDPAVGDGVFLVEASRLLRSTGNLSHATQLHGVDVNTGAVAATEEAVEHILGVRDRVDLRVLDFFDLSPPTDLLASLPFMDAVVGNPPYIRYQKFRGSNRAKALVRACQAGVNLTSLSSSWAPFVVHAASCLGRGGRLALVLPEELLHAGYASSVRTFLRETFRVTTVIRFHDYVFPDAQERVVLLLAEGRDESPGGYLRLATVNRVDDIHDLEEIAHRGELFEPQDEPRKWEESFDDAAAAILEILASSAKLVPLGEIGKANIGFVSGANDYFVLTPMEARERQFPLSLVKPSVVAARHVPGAVFTKKEFRGLMDRDERCLLWLGGGTELPQVRRYVREGEARGISGRYKCRVRDPWYVVPGVVEPDAFLTYMSDEMPRLILNRAGAACSNTLLAVRLPHARAIMRTFITMFHNSATLLSAERVGRRYGGGVLKLEPSEADRLLVPNPNLVAGHPSLEDHLLERLDRGLRSAKVDAEIRQIDEVFLRDLCGLSPMQLKIIAESRWRRRQARKRRPLRPALHASAD